MRKIVWRVGHRHPEPDPGRRWTWRWCSLDAARDPDMDKDELLARVSLFTIFGESFDGDGIVDGGSNDYNNNEKKRSYRILREKAKLGHTIDLESVSRQPSPVSAVSSSGECINKGKPFSVVSFGRIDP